jgi:hypothetical protein
VLIARNISCVSGLYSKENVMGPDARILHAPRWTTPKWNKTKTWGERKTRLRYVDICALQ